MEEEKRDFDPTEFNPWEASEEVCWFALPHLQSRDRAETLQALGRFAFMRNEYQAAATFAEEAVGILADLGDNLAVGRALMNLAVSFDQAADPETASQHFRDASSAFVKAGHYQPAAEAMMNAGTALHQMGKREEGRKLFREAVSLAKISENPVTYAEAALEYTRALFSAYKNKQARKYLDDMLQDVGTKIDASMRSQAFLELSRLEAAAGDYVAALQLAHDSRVYAEAMNLRHDFCHRALLEAHYLAELLRFDEARELLESVIEFATRDRATEITLDATIMQAQLEFDCCDYSQAAFFARTAVSLARVENADDSLKKALYRAAFACAADRDLDDAIRFYQEWQALHPEGTSRYEQPSGVVLAAFIKSRCEARKYDANIESDYAEVATLLEKKMAHGLDTFEIDCLLSIASLLRGRDMATEEFVMPLWFVFLTFQQKFHPKREAYMRLESAQTLFVNDKVENAALALAIFVELDDLKAAKYAAKILRRVQQSEIEEAGATQSAA